MRQGLTRRSATFVAALLLMGPAGCADQPQSPATTRPAPASSPPAASGSSAAPEPAPISTAAVPQSQRRPFVPVVLVLPSGTAVPVEEAEVDDAGVLDVPEEVDRAGWWTGGARAGDPFGGVVVAGHVDSARYGVGAMAELVDAAIGDEVVVEGAGERRAYRVDAIEQIPKAMLSADLGVFDQTVDERLVLITCGGEFDPVARHYADNLVVIASPVDV